MKPDRPGYEAQPRYEKLVRIAPMRFGMTVELADGGVVVHELGRSLPPYLPVRFAKPS
jgi:hypothetical protein